MFEKRHCPSCGKLTHIPTHCETPMLLRSEIKCLITTSLRAVAPQSSPGGMTKPFGLVGLSSSLIASVLFFGVTIGGSTWDSSKSLGGAAAPGVGAANGKSRVGTIVPPLERRREKGCPSKGKHKSEADCANKRAETRNAWGLQAQRRGRRQCQHRNGQTASANGHPGQKWPAGPKTTSPLLKPTARRHWS